MNRYAAMAALVLTITIASLAVAFYQIRHSHESNLRNHFETETERITAKIHWRIKAYALIVRSATGLIGASTDEVSRSEWRHYIETLNLDRLYRGIQGVGFVQLIPPGKLEAHVSKIRSEGFPEYAVTPAGVRDVYTSIVYLEPFSGRNLRAFGYDMYSEPVRRTAMELARDTDEVVFTGKVTLVQEDSSAPQAGILAYSPVYAATTRPQTIEQRRATLKGWTYSPYRMNDLMEGMLRDDLAQIRLEIYDGTRPEPDSLLYDSHPQANLQPTFNSSVRIELKGRHWTLRYSSLPGFEAAAGFQPPWVQFSVLLIISLLLIGITWSFINTRRRAGIIAEKLTASLRKSREQLRATFEQAGVGIAHIEPGSLHVLRVNDRFCEIVGYTREELKRISIRQLWHPDDSSLGNEQRLQVEARSIGSFSIEKRYIHKSGQLVWLHITLSGIFSLDGKLEYYLAIFEDISRQKDYAAALQASEERYRETSRSLSEVIWGTHIGTWKWNVQTGETEFNERWAEIIGHTLAELSPVSIETWTNLVHPEDLPHSEEALKRCFSGEADLYECEARMRHKDGSFVWVLDRGRVVEWTEDGKPLRMSGTHQDITARKRAEARLQLAASVFTHAREGIVITDRDAHIIDVNDTFTRITGYSRAEAVGQLPRLLKSGRHPLEFYEAMWRALIDEDEWCGEIWNRRKSGEIYVELLNISTIRDASGKITNYLALFTDITPMKEHQEELEHFAHHDALTGLPNRVLLADRLQQAMVQAERRSHQLAVVYLDLDGFKAVNDKHGHDKGDELLITIARRMSDALRGSDTLARIGGDEFVAVLVDLETPQDHLPILGRLLNAAATPVSIGTATMEVSASIGFTLYPDAGKVTGETRNAEQLMAEADQAMYKAKRAGKNRYQAFEEQA